MAADKGKSHQKKMEIRVDFTPMVDMNMLLLTFFMLCTTMIKSQTLQIALPSNEKVDKTEQNKVKQSEAITIILDSERDADVKDELTGKMLKGPVRAGGDKIYYYEGQAELIDENKDGVLDVNKMQVTTYDQTTKTALELRSLLQKRNKKVLERINKLKESWRDGKLTDEAYQAEAKKVRNDSTLVRPVVIIKATNNASYENLINTLDEMQINQIARYQIDHLNSADSAMMLNLGVVFPTTEQK